MSEKRRDIRYAARIVARVVKKTETEELLTHEVSFRGAFLRTDAPLGLRQLLKVSFSLPSGATVSAHAMVVHAVAPDPSKGVVPGMGLQFWGPVDGARAGEGFIHELRRREHAGMPNAKLTDKVRRASERIKLSIDVALDGARAMVRDISFNGLAVRTDLAMPIGVRARLELSGPGGEPVAVDVLVRRVIDEPGFRGLGVEMVDVTEEQKAAIIELVRAHAPPESLTRIAVGDPRLH